MPQAMWGCRQSRAMTASCPTANLAVDQPIGTVSADLQLYGFEVLVKGEAQRPRHHWLPPRPPSCPYPAKRVCTKHWRRLLTAVKAIDRMWSKTQNWLMLHAPTRGPALLPGGLTTTAVMLDEDRLIAE